MKESTSPIRVNLKRLALLLGLGLVALLLSVLPKEKRVVDTNKYPLDNNSGDSALIPTARADDFGIISLTGGCAATSCSCSGK